MQGCCIVFHPALPQPRGSTRSDTRTIRSWRCTPYRNRARGFRIEQLRERAQTRPLRLEEEPAVPGHPLIRPTASAPRYRVTISTRPTAETRPAAVPKPRVRPQCRTPLREFEEVCSTIFGFELEPVRVTAPSGHRSGVTARSGGGQSLVDSMMGSIVKTGFHPWMLSRRVHDARSCQHRARRIGSPLTR